MCRWISTALPVLFLPFVIGKQELECTRKCTVTDADVTCWESSLEFFTDRVRQSLSDYARLLMHVSRWKESHLDHEGAKNETLEENIIQRVLNTEKELEGPLTSDDLHDLLHQLLNMTLKHVPEYEDETEVLPWVACPVPCDYYPRLWSALFYTVLTCFLLCLVTLTVYIWNRSRKVDSGYMLQKSVET